VVQKEAAAPERPKAKRMGFDPLRPFRYGMAFTGGTVGGLLDGMAHQGRKGMWAGLAIGLLLCIGGGFSAPFLIGGAAAGLLGGAVLGGAFGGLTGGVKSTNRIRRREKYADELAEHASARGRRTVQSNAPERGVDYREAYAARQRISDYNFDRAVQQERENDRDERTYWQDREAARGAGGMGRGW
jgi:hypothetical protein